MWLFWGLYVCVCAIQMNTINLWMDFNRVILLLLLFLAILYLKSNNTQNEAQMFRNFANRIYKTYGVRYRSNLIWRFPYIKIKWWVEGNKKKYKTFNTRQTRKEIQLWIVPYLRNFQGVSECFIWNSMRNSVR